MVAGHVFARHIGLTLEEIGRELATLPRNRVPERSDWAQLSGTWTARIDERIAELRRLRAGLGACIDRAARRGAGPRRWVEAPPES